MYAPREAALEELRHQQERARASLGVVVPIGKGNTLDGALKKAAAREDTPIEGGWVYSSGFRYPEAAERLRWARTRDIIVRSSPGGDEDASYLEMLARQAASIEMVLRGEYAGEPNAQNTAICDQVLLGTFPSINPDAFARRHGDFFFVLVSAGLIEFVYQAAKAVVLSWKQVPPAPGGRVGFRSDREDVEEVLARDPAPLMLLKKTLDEYLFRGLPRAQGYSPPPADYQGPLAILTNFNERFILAHEYGHTLHDALDVVYPRDSSLNEESAADLLAFRLVVTSGDALDLLPPNFSTQGAFFVLTAMDIIRQSLDLVRHGEVREDRGLGGHSPNRQRLELLKAYYRRSVSDKDDDLSIKPALAPAATLLQLWERMLKDGAIARWQGKTLHRIWDGA